MRSSFLAILHPRSSILAVALSILAANAFAQSRTVLNNPAVQSDINMSSHKLTNLPATVLADWGITNAQPLDSDLTAIAALATDSFGRALLTKTDAPGIRTYIGAGTSSFDGVFASLTSKPTTLSGYGITDAQPLDADLTSLGAGTGTNTLYYRSALNTWSPVSIGANLSFSGGTLNTIVTLFGNSASAGTIPLSDGTNLENSIMTESAGTVVVHGDLKVDDGGTSTLIFGQNNVSPGDNTAVFGRGNTIIGPGSATENSTIFGYDGTINNVAGAILFAVGGGSTTVTTPDSFTASAGTIVLDAAIFKLPNFTTNGFLKVSGGTGLLGVDTSSYSLLGHAHAAGDITSGTMATARLGSGTANSSSFLRGDQTWTAVTVPTIASTSAILKGDGSGNAIAATPGTDFATAAQGVTTLSLITPSVIYSTPVTFTNTAGAWAGTLSLINQAANTVFGNFTAGSATPTFSAAPTFSGANLTNLSLANISGTSANLRTALSDELGTGAALFDGATPTSFTLTNATGLPPAGVTGTAAILGANTFTAQQVNSYSGTASTPAMKYSGVPFAGTGTTSFPLVYINDANATASTTLNTAGTYFGVNGDGTQDLINLLKDGTSVFKVSSAGATVAASTIAATSGLVVYSSGTTIHSQLDTGNLYTRKDFSLKWNDTVVGGGGNIFATGSFDTGLTRNAAGVVEMNNATAIGATITNARDLTLRNLFGANPAGTNIAGGDLGLSVGLGTGSGAPGNIILYGAAAGSSGTTQETKSAIGQIYPSGGFYWGATPADPGANNFKVQGTLNVTGIPTIPTAAVDTNTTQAATTAFVLAQAAAATPIVAGTGAVGTSTRYARADHVHPAQTTVTGNAGTATALQTARTINGVSFNGTANITVGPGYLTYVATVTQSGTDAPVATVLQNTLGGTVVWTYSAPGVYIGTLTGAFTANKTFASITVGGQKTGARTVGAQVRQTSADTIELNTEDFQASVSAFADECLDAYPASLEIRVYP